VLTLLITAPVVLKIKHCQTLILAFANQTFMFQIMIVLNAMGIALPALIPHSALVARKEWSNLMGCASATQAHTTSYKITLAKNVETNVMHVHKRMDALSVRLDTIQILTTL
jgi:hypothetical protein